MAPKQIKRLQFCCGCFSLQSGTIISGVGCMILAVLTIIFVIYTDQPIDTILLELPQNVVKIILVFNLFMTMMISGLLILGVLKEKKFYMLPWIILGIVLVVCLFISVILTAIKYYQNDKGKEALIVLIIGFIIACIYFYMWFVVYSYYIKLREEDRRLPYYKPPYKTTR